MHELQCKRARALQQKYDGLHDAVIDATKIIEDYRRLSCSVEKLFFNFNFFWIFFATPDRAQREQPIGGLKNFVRARVRSAWRVEV